MGIRFYKPITPASRLRSVSTFDDLETSTEPENSLTFAYHRKKGRNNNGRITSRHRGGGHKKNYRLLDTKRNKIDIFGKVKTVEYDPNRNSLISLIVYQDGEKRYILYPLGLKIGQMIISSNDKKVGIYPGNSMPLGNLPLGSHVHNIEFHPNAGGKIARSAGTFAQMIAKQGNFVILRIPSGEVRVFLKNCWSTIGEVGNAEINNIRLGKAGRKRWLGFRPHVRGSAMNIVDHPHGGGEGKSPIGRPSPMTPWGKPTLGKKTRKNRKYSHEFILERRKKKTKKA